MFISKKHLSRRTFLRGAGVTMALPFLESMVPAQTPLRQTVANPGIRLGFLYCPHGAMMDTWTPKTEGSRFELSRSLMPLEPVKDRLVVVSNLAHHSAGPEIGESGGEHSRSPSVFLSGTRPKRTGSEDVRLATTADQIAAAKIGRDTRLPSLELATEDFSGITGSCDVGLSCTYRNTNSWRTPTTPLPMEINPRVVFNLLFGAAGTSAERAARLKREQSILDLVAGDTRSLQKDLGVADRARMDEYLESVREIERRIALVGQSSVSDVSLPAAPIGIPSDHEAHSKLMLDLMVLAFQTETTRVSTFMMAREVSSRAFPNLGVSDAFHPVSHHGNRPEQLEKYTKINTYHVWLAAQMLEKMKATPDGDGTLLDHSLILFGSSMSNGNLHNQWPLPVFLAGGAGGRMKGDRHLMYPKDTPMSNLLLSVLDKAGIQQDSLGDSTGLLDGV